MNLFAIAFKSIRQRGLASSLTAVSVALGVMLMVAVLVIHGIIDRMFNQQEIGYDLIVGPRGSDLNLVLTSVYRVSTPKDNLPYMYYEQLKNNFRVKTAIPIAIGDTTDKGNFPIVGTTNDYFAIDYAPDKSFRAYWKEGYNGLKEDMDAIIGAEVARRNGWDIGSTFRLIHSGTDAHVHNELFTVVGVLQRTHTPNDKTAFISLKGFYKIADHGKPFDEMITRLENFYGKTYSEEEKTELKRNPNSLRLKEVSAIFIVTRSEDGGDRSSALIPTRQLMGEINSSSKAWAVNPIEPMKDLMEIVVGNIQMVLLVLVALIIAVSGVSIFVSIYNSMSDRKKEIAIMRALGARRQTVFLIILTESILLCLTGGLLGMILGHGLVFAAAPVFEAKTGLIIDPFAFVAMELVIIPVLIGMASLIGFIPGMTAYRTDVAQTLSD